MGKVLSDVILMPKNGNFSLKNIETFLSGRYEDIVRWAIVEDEGENVKINVSYRLN